MADHVVRSVLGDERLAGIYPGGGYPWYSCPFCTYAVYVSEANPEHGLGATPAVHGQCGNPWCIANPAMPRDAAERIVKAAQDAADAAARRQRDRDVTRQRIDEYAASQALARDRVTAEARQRGACLRCALKAWRLGREKYTVHRSGQCTGTRQNSATF